MVPIEIVEGRECAGLDRLFPLLPYTEGQMTEAFMKDTALTTISRRAGTYLSGIFCVRFERLMSLFIVSAVRPLFPARPPGSSIGVGALPEMPSGKSSTVNVSCSSWSSRSERL